MTKGPDLALEEGLLSSYIEKPNINMKHVQNTGLLNGMEVQRGSRGWREMGME